MSKPKANPKKQPEIKSNPMQPLKKDGSSLFFEKRGLLILLLLLTVISVLVYHDFLTFNKLYIYEDIGSDSYNLFNPQLVHFTNYLRTDGIPKWSFNQGMGQNVFPGGISDPFTLFLFLFDGNHISYAIVYAQLLKIIVGGIIFFYYLKTIGISPFASVVGALLFSFSGYMILGGCWYGHATSMVFGAFLLFAFEKLYKKNAWGYFPFAVALISPDIFSLYIYCAFLFLYTLVRYYQEHDFKSTGIITLLLKMAGLGLLGIAIYAVFSISPVLQMINSPRVSGEAGLFNSLKAAPVFGFADPIEYMSAIMRSFCSDLMGSGSQFKGWQNYLEAPIFYAGLISLLLIPQVFQFLDKKRKIIFGNFLGLWVLIVTFPYIRHSLYLFAGDYYKTGLSFFVPVTMMFMGVTALNYIDKLNKINIKVLIVTLVILFIALFYSYLPNNENYLDLKLRSVVVVFLVVYAVLIWLLSVNSFKNISKVMLLICLSTELGYLASITTNNRMALSKNEMEEKIGFNDYTVDAVKYLKSTDKSFYRVNKNYFSGTAIHGSLDDAFIQDYYGTPSYESFNQLYYIKFLGETNVLNPKDENQTRWAMGLVNRPLLQTFANIKYTLTKNFDPNLYGMNDSIAGFGDVKIFKNKYYLPLGYSYNNYILERDFKKLSDLEKDKSLFQAFVIDSTQTEKYKEFTPHTINDTTNNLSFEQYAQYIAELKKDTLAITAQSQNLIKGNINLDKKKLLFFSIPYDEGWHATVDGKNVELQLVNIGFMGLVLEKGMHNVVLQFKPPYVKEGLWISCTGLLLYLLGIGMSFFRKRLPK